MNWDIPEIGPNMHTKEQIQRGLEFIEGKLKITIKKDLYNISVFIFTEYPKNQNSIKLFISCYEPNHFCIQDLYGNGYYSKYQHKGYGSMIFSIGLQAISCAYQSRNFNAEEIMVTGYVSNEGDPSDEPEKTQCSNFRNTFWQTRGFSLLNPDKSNTTMQAKLSELLKTDIDRKRNSRKVMLDNFWCINERPPLLKYDINTLKSIQLDKNTLPNIISEEVVNEHLNQAINCSRKLLRVGSAIVFFVLILFCYFYSKVTEEVLILIPIYLFGLMTSYYRLLEYLCSKLPTYKKYRRLFKQRQNALSTLKNSIVNIEDSNNGFVWRLHEGLVGMDPDYETEKYEHLSILSKNQSSYQIADDYALYVNFILHLKSRILN